MLVDHGADVNAKNGIAGDPEKAYNYTPLHWAAQFGHLESARLLLERGADQWASNINNDQPIDLALRWRRSQLVDFLSDPHGYVPQADAIDIPSCYGRFKESFGSYRALEQCQSLRQLASLYQDRRDFKNASLVYNSALALARQYQFSQEISSLLADLETLEGLFAASIGYMTPEHHSNYLDKYQEHLQQDRAQLEEDLAQGLPIDKIHKKLATKYWELFSLLCIRCLEVVGTPPLPFTVFALGSWAREEVRPYSQIKFGLLVNTDTTEMRTFFQKFTQLLEFKLCCLGETAYNLIYSGQNSENERGAYSFVPKGFGPNQFGFTPKGKSGVFELFGTVEQMAFFLRPEWLTRHDQEYDVVEEMSCCQFLCGDKNLMAAFESRCQQILNAAPSQRDAPARNTLARNLLRGLIAEFENVKRAPKERRIIDVRKDLYRPLQRLIKVLGLFYGCQKKNTIDCLCELEKDRKFTPQAAAKIRQALQEASRWRIRCQMYYRNGLETCYYLPGQKDRESPVLFIDDADLQSLQNIYQVLHPLYAAAAAFLRGSENAFANSTCFDDTQKLILPKVKPNAFVPSGSALEALCMYSKECDFDVILSDAQFEQELPQYYEQYLIKLQRAYSALKVKHGGNAHLDIADVLTKMGTVNAFLNDHKSSLRDLREALRVYQQCPESNALIAAVALPSAPALSGNEQIIAKKLAHLLNNLGTVSLLLQEPGADECLERAIALAHRLTENPSHLLARTFFNLGSFYLAKGNYNPALEKFKQALLKLRETLKARLDVSIPLCVTQTGMIYHRIDKFDEAYRHLTEALELYKRIYQQAHADIAFGQEYLARTAFMLGRVDESARLFISAVSTLNEAHQNRPHPIITRFYSKRGAFWEEQQNWAKAAESYDHAIKNCEKIKNSSLITALLLCRRGDCLTKLGSEYLAIDCYVRADQLSSQFYEDQPHRDRCQILVTLGQLYERQGEYKQAFDCYHKTLKMAMQLNDRNLQKRALDLAGNLYMTLRKRYEASPFSILGLEIYQKHYRNHFCDLVDLLQDLANGWDTLDEFIKSGFYRRQLMELFRLGPKSSPSDIARLQRELTHGDSVRPRFPHSLFNPVRMPTRANQSALPEGQRDPENAGRMTWHRIFSQLNAIDIFRLGMVNRYLHRLTSDTELYKILLKRDFPSIPAVDSKTAYQSEFLLRDHLQRKKWQTETLPLPVRQASSANCLLQHEGRLYAGFHQSIQIWDQRNNRWLPPIEGVARGRQGFLENNGRFYAGTQNNAILILNLSTHEHLASLSGHTDSIECLLQDGDRLFSGSRDHTIRVWDLTSNQCLATLQGHSEPIVCLLVKDGKLYSGSHDKSIKVWDLSNFTCCATWSKPQRPVTWLTALGNRFFSLAGDRTIEEWDLDKQEHRHTFSDPSADTIVAMIAIRGKLIYGTASGTICVWDLETHQCVATLQGHRQAAYQLLEKEGKLYSASRDATIQIWDLQTYKKLATSPELESFGCLFEQAGKIYSVSGSSLTIWDLFPKPQVTQRRG
ncbi:MAG: tetratricopeptide repeat protein [Parachlamydia sp.]|nr:tetratricopeptide repeat protein [Parachlamydia sp.]